MSECVVRMEMPEKCFNCDLRYECNAFYASRKPKPFMKGCMIVCQLPKGHGRLADKDLLMRDLDFLNTFGTPDDGKELSYEDILVTIDDFPTIVPAEAERSE